MLKASSLVKIFICTILAALILLVPLCGCQENNNSMSADTVTFTDALERQVSVQKSPQRVAALIGSFAEIWQLAGGTVCATAEDAWDDFGLSLGDAVNIGGAHSPNLELLLSSSPDFVIASASTAADVDMCQSLESAGICVAYFDVDSFYDYLDMLRICTDITGRRDLYNENGSNLLESINKIKDSLSFDKKSDAERKILLLRASANTLKAKGSSGTVLGEMLCDLGAVNIADSDTSLLENLSIESIIKGEPHHIFVVTMGDDTIAATKNLTRILEENPAWQGLDAVRENRVHIMERRLFNIKPNVRWAEAYEKLAEILQS